jgi:hypothetical protein
MPAAPSPVIARPTSTSQLLKLRRMDKTHNQCNTIWGYPYFKTHQYRTPILIFPELTTNQAAEFKHSNTEEKNGFERKIFIRFAPGGLEGCHGQKEGGRIPIPPN